MLHLLGVKTNRCLLLLIVMSLLSMNVYGWQAISLAGSLADNKITEGNDYDQIVSGPFHVLYEHALCDYHRYYELGNFCQLDDPKKIFDITLAPAVEYLGVRDSSRSILNYGGFICAEFNWNQLWIRAYDFVGQVVEHQNQKSKKGTGADDVVIKVGYDLCCDFEKHFGVYLLGSLPTNRNLEATAIRKSANTVKLLFNTPLLGSKNFQIGGGFAGAYSLYNYASNNISLLFDCQYSYAIPATYASLDASVMESPDSIILVPHYKQSRFEKNQARVTFTPGHSLINWIAFHVASDCFSVELGGEVSIGFASKTVSKLDNNPKNLFVLESFEWIRPSPALSIKPYLALSYLIPSKTVPVSFGLGIAYEYNEVLRTLKEVKIPTPNFCQGLNAWATVGFDF